MRSPMARGSERGVRGGVTREWLKGWIEFTIWVSQMALLLVLIYQISRTTATNITGQQENTATVTDKGGSALRIHFYLNQNAMTAKGIVPDYC
jgi:hypothetical protein